MTDEERQKLIARFRAHEVVMWTDIDLAADELERLAQLLAELEQGDRDDIAMGMTEEERMRQHLFPI